MLTPLLAAEPLVTDDAFTDLLGYAGGILLSLSFLPQVIKTWRVKHADDVSMGMLVITLGSALFYELYAFRLGLMPVVVMNGIFAVLVLTEIVLKARFDRRPRTAAGPDA